MGIVLKWHFKTLLTDKVRLVMAILCVFCGNATLIGLCALLDGFASGIGSLNIDDSLFHFLSVIFPPMSQALMGLSMFAMFSVNLAESKQQITLMNNVGATKIMLIETLLLEALLLSLVGLLSGSAAGFLIAWLQLRQMGISTDFRGFLFSSDGARCILPSLLIVPAAMMAAYARNTFIGTVKKKLPGKKRKAAFSGGLLNKLLGIGGRLGHARSAGGSADSRPVVASVVAAFTLLFLMTTGISIIGGTESSYSEHNYISLYVNSQTNSLSGLPEILKDLDRITAAGNLQGESGSHISCVFLGCVASKKDFESYFEGEIFSDAAVELGQDRFLVGCNVYFIPHEEFLVTCNACGAIPQMDGAVLCEDSRFPFAGKAEFIKLPKEVISDYYTWQNNESERQYLDHLVNESPRYTPDIIGQQPDEIPEEFNDAHGYIFPSLYYDIGYWNAFCSSALMNTAPVVRAYWYFNAERLDEEHPELAFRIQSYLSGLGFETHIRTLGDGLTSASEPGQALILSSGYLSDSYKSLKEQLQQFYTRYFTVMIFVTVLLDVICIVHMDRFSQRKEYAIFMSIGLGPAQRLAMQVYYALVLTAKVVLYGILSMLLLSTVISEHASDAISNEQVTFSNVVIEEWSDNFFMKMVYTGIIIGRALSSYIPFVVAAIALLFVSYLVTDMLTTRRLERKDLITIIKNDLSE